jgi:hypothetical protein
MKITKARAEELLQRLQQLRKDGQIEPICGDAKLFFTELEDEFGEPKRYSSVRITLDIENVVVPRGVDVCDPNNYDITMKFPVKGMDSGDFIVEDIDWEEE